MNNIALDPPGLRPETTIADLRGWVALHAAHRDKVHSPPIRGVFRVEFEAEAASRQGEAVYRLRLYDVTGITRAFVLANVWDGPPPTPGMVTALELNIRESHSVPHVIVEGRYPAVRSGRSHLDLLPAHLAPQPNDLSRLIHLARGLNFDVYRLFLDDAFRDLRLAVPFITLPAGKSCHHTQPGGLLSHSVEIAEAVQRTTRCISGNPLTSDAAVLLALFHDVGKVTLAQYGERIPPQHHTDLIESELLTPLSRLRDHDMDAYSCLLHMICCYRERRDYENPLAAVIRGLDGWSAQTDASAGRRTVSKHDYRLKPCARSRAIWDPPHQEQRRRQLF